MLYDPKWEPKTDLSKPSLRGLAYVLRHKELWPIGFEWNFGDCETCAMGLAARLWSFETPCAYTTAIHLGIPERTSRNLFLQWRRPDMPITAVTPKLIADRIDAVMETVSERR